MSYNKIIAMGRLTRDVELKTIPSGTPVCEMGLAMDSGWGDNKKTCFVDVTVWGKQAEFVSKYFKKGDGVHLEGRLDYSTWEKDGQKRSKHSITAERVTFPVGASKKEADTTPTSEVKSKWEAAGTTQELPF